MLTWIHFMQVKSWERWLNGSDHTSGVEERRPVIDLKHHTCSGLRRPLRGPVRCPHSTHFLSLNYVSGFKFLCPIKASVHTGCPYKNPDKPTRSWLVLAALFSLHRWAGCLLPTFHLPVHSRAQRLLCKASIFPGPKSGYGTKPVRFPWLCWYVRNTGRQPWRLTLCTLRTACQHCHLERRQGALCKGWCRQCSLPQGQVLKEGWQHKGAWVFFHGPQ